MSQADDNAVTDSSLAADGHFDDALRRVSFEPGMLLGIEATRAEQEYHRRRDNRHAYWLHGSGTVVGLRVSLQGEDPGDDTSQVKVRLIVSPGIGVDGLGRQVSVFEPYCVDLHAWLTTVHADAEAWAALIRDGYDEADKLLWLKVTMRYQDCPSGLQPVMATAINAGTDPVGPSRMQDTVLYELVAERPADAAARQHPFAAHNGLRDYAEIVDQLGAGEQQRVADAGGGARVQLELGARLLYALGDDNQALLTRESFTLTAADLARTLLARVSIRLTDELDLIVNPRRISVDNLVRPFLFNASTLARLLRD